MKKHFYLAFLVILITSCAAKHNVPISLVSNKVEKPNKIYSFVDQNGNFYPDNWRENYGNPPKNAKRTEFSLMKNATELNKISDLQQFELKFLNQVQSFIKNKKRVFVLIHGFNANEKDASESYNLLQSKLNLNTSKDAVIQFYWNGLQSEYLFGGAKIWFDATNNSQLAGEFGLRRVLNAIKGKDVYLISHSRGASVILSALTFSEISESLIQETKEVHNVDVYNDSKDLLNNNNNIYAIMLAPAIGLTDFQINLSESKKVIYKKFTPQLKVIHITINDSDKMLGKLVGFLSNKLKPTDLGYKLDTFSELSKEYNIIKMTDFSGLKSHKFNDYINNNKFMDILSKVNLN